MRYGNFAFLSTFRRLLCRLLAIWLRLFCPGITIRPFLPRLQLSPRLSYMLGLRASFSSIAIFLFV